MEPEPATVVEEVFEPEPAPEQPAAPVEEVPKPVVEELTEPASAPEPAIPDIKSPDEDDGLALEPSSVTQKVKKKKKKIIKKKAKEEPAAVEVPTIEKPTVASPPPAEVEEATHIPIAIIEEPQTPSVEPPRPSLSVVEVEEAASPTSLQAADEPKVVTGIVQEPESPAQEPKQAPQIVEEVVVEEKKQVEKKKRVVKQLPPPEPEEAKDKFPVLKKTKPAQKEPAAKTDKVPPQQLLTKPTLTSPQKDTTKPVEAPSRLVTLKTAGTKRSALDFRHDDEKEIAAVEVEEHVESTEAVTKKKKLVKVKKKKVASSHPKTEAGQEPAEEAVAVGYSDQTEATETYYKVEEPASEPEEPPQPTVYSQVDITQSAADAPEETPVHFKDEAHKTVLSQELQESGPVEKAISQSVPTVETAKAKKQVLIEGAGSPTKAKDVPAIYSNIEQEATEAAEPEEIVASSAPTQVPRAKPKESSALGATQQVTTKTTETMQDSSTRAETTKALDDRARDTQPSKPVYATIEGEQEAGPSSEEVAPAAVTEPITRAQPIQKKEVPPAAVATKQLVPTVEKAKPDTIVAEEAPLKQPPPQDLPVYRTTEQQKEPAPQIQELVPMQQAPATPKSKPRQEEVRGADKKAVPKVTPVVERIEEPKDVAAPKPDAIPTQPDVPIYAVQEQMQETAPAAEEVATVKAVPEAPKVTPTEQTAQGVNQVVLPEVTPTVDTAERLREVAKPKEAEKAPKPDVAVYPTQTAEKEASPQVQEVVTAQTKVETPASAPIVQETRGAEHIAIPEATPTVASTEESREDRAVPRTTLESQPDIPVYRTQEQEKEPSPEAKEVVATAPTVTQKATKAKSTKKKVKGADKAALPAATPTVQPSEATVEDAVAKELSESESKPAIPSVYSTQEQVQERPKVEEIVAAVPSQDVPKVQPQEEEVKGPAQTSLPKATPSMKVAQPAVDVAKERDIQLPPRPDQPVYAQVEEEGKVVETDEAVASSTQKSSTRQVQIEPDTVRGAKDVAVAVSRAALEQKASAATDQAKEVEPEVSRREIAISAGIEQKANETPRVEETASTTGKTPPARQTTAEQVKSVSSKAIPHTTEVIAEAKPPKDSVTSQLEPTTSEPAKTPVYSQEVQPQEEVAATSEVVTGTPQTKTKSTKVNEKKVKGTKKAAVSKATPTVEEAKAVPDAAKATSPEDVKFEPSMPVYSTTEQEKEASPSVSEVVAATSTPAPAAEQPVERDLPAADKTAVPQLTESVDTVKVPPESAAPTPAKVEAESFPIYAGVGEEKEAVPAAQEVVPQKAEKKASPSKPVEKTIPSASEVAVSEARATVDETREAVATSTEITPDTKLEQYSVSSNIEAETEQVAAGQEVASSKDLASKEPKVAPIESTVSGAKEVAVPEATSTMEESGVKAAEAAAASEAAAAPEEIPVYSTMEQEKEPSPEKQEVVPSKAEVALTKRTPTQQEVIGATKQAIAELTSTLQEEKAQQETTVQQKEKLDETLPDVPVYQEVGDERETPTVDEAVASKEPVQPPSSATTIQSEATGPTQVARQESTPSMERTDVSVDQTQPQATLSEADKKSAPAVYSNIEAQKEELLAACEMVAAKATEPLTPAKPLESTLPEQEAVVPKSTPTVATSASEVEVTAPVQPEAAAPASIAVPSEVAVEQKSAMPAQEIVSGEAPPRRGETTPAAAEVVEPPEVQTSETKAIEHPAAAALLSPADSSSDLLQEEREVKRKKKKKKKAKTAAATATAVEIKKTSEKSVRFDETVLIEGTAEAAPLAVARDDDDVAVRIVEPASETTSQPREVVESAPPPPPPALTAEAAPTTSSSTSTQSPREESTPTTSRRTPPPEPPPPQQKLQLKTPKQKDRASAPVPGKVFAVFIGPPLFKDRNAWWRSNRMMEHGLTRLPPASASHSYSCQCCRHRHQSCYRLIDCMIDQ